MKDNQEYCPFILDDLISWAPDGERQAKAWDRLRRVCIELRLKVPSLVQVNEMRQDLNGRTYYAAMQRWNNDSRMFPEELASIVICEPLEGKGIVFVQFDAGYCLE